MKPEDRSARRGRTRVGLRELMVPSSRAATVLGLAMAVVAPILAAILIKEVGGERFPSLPFLVAILCATLVGQLMSGLVAIVISTVLIDYLFIGTPNRFGPLRWREVVSLVVFGVVTLVIAEILARARIARRTADEARERAQESEARFEALAEASRLLASSLDSEKTMQRAVSLAAEHMADWAHLFVPDERGGLWQSAIASSDLDTPQHTRDLMRTYTPDLSNERSYVVRAFLTGGTQVFGGLTEDEIRSYASTDEELSAFRRLPIRSGLSLPLVIRGQVLGVLALTNTVTDRTYDDEDLAFAEELARRIARSMENARLFAERDDIARTLQDSLLPSSIPAPAGIEIAFRYVAAGARYDVGGDFYDLFKGEDDSWIGVVGDVCGKGPEAAAVMGIARYTLRAYALRESRPSALLTGLNEALIAQDAGRFCTVVCVRLKRIEDHVRLTSCVGGHPRPVVIRADGSAELVGRFGTLLGVFDDVDLTDVPLDLYPGDALILYTDGLDGPDEDAEDAVVSAVGGRIWSGAEELADHLLSARSDETASKRDDFALLVLLVGSP